VDAVGDEQTEALAVVERLITLHATLKRTG
jgi:hypothetical protein